MEEKQIEMMKKLIEEKKKKSSQQNFTDQTHTKITGSKKAVKRNKKGGLFDK
ncbi:MAG: hypothetical protein K0Q99_538 [Clostridia bacterium]|jgi:non-homologous end joining protein Ku|nr:hypothetical protein [Clostridia bacterium]